MEFLKDLREMSLLIVPSILKEKVLEYIEKNHLFFPFKLMTLKEVRSSFYFEYNESAVYFIQKRYNVKKEIAEVYLENLYYIDQDESENMHLLIEIKEALEQEKLLSYSPSFSSYLKTCRTYVFGYDVFTKFEKDLLNKIEQYTSLQYIEPSLYPLKEAYLCENVDEEIQTVFEEISCLLTKGVPLSKIYLTNITREIYPKIKRISKNYHIPIQPEKKYLYATPIYQEIKMKLLEKKSVETSLPYMEEVIQKINQIQNLENYDLEEVLDAIAKEICLEEEYTNYLKIEPLCDNYYAKDSYVFVLNANQSLLPMTYKDEDFLYDTIKPSILESTKEKNKLSYEQAKKALLKIKNKKVFLIQEEEGIMHYPSPLLEETTVIKVEKNEVSHASHLQNKKNLVVLLDEERKYGTISPNLLLLKKNYPLAYLSYTPTFTGIEKDKLMTYLGEKIVLSYSSLNTFYECSFKYYLDYILKLSSYEETFSLFLGNLFHLLLKEQPENTADFITSYLESKNKSLSKKEEFYLKNNLRDLESILLFWEDFKRHSSFALEETEKKVTISFSDKWDFVGIIDKKWVHKEENLSILVDYKTGSTSFDLRDTFYGLGMQLPIYYYLAKKENPTQKVLGFYLQNLLEKNFQYKKNKTEEEQKKDSLKLNGYSLAQEELLQKVDTTYQDSRFIKGLKKTQTGFYVYSKVLSERQMDFLYALVEEKIKNMIHEIEKASFPINPKKIRKENVSCKYCKYQSICFKEETMVKELEEIKDLHFLGGDKNDEMDDRTAKGNF